MELVIDFWMNTAVRRNKSENLGFRCLASCSDVLQLLDFFWIFIRFNKSSRSWGKWWSRKHEATHINSKMNKTNAWDWNSHEEEQDTGTQVLRLMAFKDNFCEAIDFDKATPEFTLLPQSIPLTAAWALHAIDEKRDFFWPDHASRWGKYQKFLKISANDAAIHRTDKSLLFWGKPFLTILAVCFSVRTHWQLKIPHICEKMSDEKSKTRFRADFNTLARAFPISSQLACPGT